METVKLRQIFQNSNYLFESSNFRLTAEVFCCQFFPWSDRLTSSILKEIPTNGQAWIISVPVSRSRKYTSRSLNKQLVQFMTTAITRYFTSRPHLLWAAKLLCAYVPFCNVNLSKDLIEPIICTVLSKTFLSEASILLFASAHWRRTWWLSVQFGATVLVQTPAFFPHHCFCNMGQIWEQ